MKIVSNSSPLIALAKIEMLDVLSGVVIPKAVFDEITKPKREYAKELHGWGKDKVTEVKSRKAVEYVVNEIEKVIFNKDYVCIYEMPYMWWRTKEKGGKE